VLFGIVFVIEILKRRFIEEPIEAKLRRFERRRTASEIRKLGYLGAELRILIAYFNH
jgi:hypothetical protein